MLREERQRHSERAASGLPAHSNEHDGQMPWVCHMLWPYAYLVNQMPCFFSPILHHFSHSIKTWLKWEAGGGRGNRGPSQCGSTHEATSGMSSCRSDICSGLNQPKLWITQLLNQLDIWAFLRHLDKNNSRGSGCILLFLMFFACLMSLNLE